MNKILMGSVGAGVVAAIAGALIYATSGPEVPSGEDRLGDAAAARAANKGVIDLICELKLDLDGQLALGITANEPNRITMAQIDFSKNAGWYQGKIAISEGRAGNLTVSGNLLRVSRPAMFQRFGVMITQEEFTVDRSTGEFTQTLSIRDAKPVTLIRGTCAKVIKPPF